jgi:carotenoid cleavage dioxygenase-like enzyme
MSDVPSPATDNHRPVREELTATDLPVVGAIPPELTGWYLRNGPNPRHDDGNWFTGEGMIHGVRLAHGRAIEYRNRWVRTRSFLAGGGAIYGPHGERDLTVSAANTHVVNHAGHTLALVETSLPYEIDRQLRTIGAYDFGGRLRNSMTAHPKICPRTGEMHLFGYGSLEKPHVSYHRVSAAGALEIERPVDVPGLTMMHDFHLTQRYIVFMDLPVIFDQQLRGRGAMPYRWDDDYGARLGVMRRDDPHAPIRWLEIEPCYVFHAVNAFDRGDELVLHVVRYPHFWRGDALTEASLWQWTIDLIAGRVRESQLDDRPCEFPRIDDRLTGLNARFAHVTDAASSSERSGSIIQYDLHTHASSAHTFGPGRIPGEAVFIPADADGQPTTDRNAGWLLTYVYDRGDDRSELVILDATDLSREPAAAIALPARVPAGFHGSWIPD